MSNDLISRKAAVELLIAEYDRFEAAGGSHSGRFEIEKCIKILENMPTAYDKEKVIEKIKEERDEAKEYNQESSMVAHEIDIEIVESGGIE